MMPKEIIDNLVSFYTEAARFQGLEMQQLFEMHFLHNRNAHWPNALIGTCSKEEASRVLELINDRHVPPFWIMNGMHTTIDRDWLANKGCREVQRWEGMWCDKQHFNGRYQQNKAASLVLVDRTATILQWSKLVREVMIPNKVLAETLVNGWLADDNHRLMLIFEEEIPVAAGLLYLAGQTAGIYFIATLPEYQRKGHGSSMVSALVDYAFMAGASKVILHASAAGLKMYLKLGFVPEGPISTFWKIGIF